MKKAYSQAKELLLISFATILIGVSVYFFLQPSTVSIGSISSLAIILANFIPLPMSTITMILNVILLILGFIFIGRGFGAKTVYTSILLPLSIGACEKLFPDLESVMGEPFLDTDFDVAIMRGVVEMDELPYMLQMPDFKFNYQPEVCEISNANIVFGNSDYFLTGKVNGLEDWISHEGMLTGDLYFTSNYTNVDDLMDVLSGLGSDKDTLEAQREEAKVPKEANPFIVPKDVDFTLHTNIREVYAFDNELQSLAGDVRICDGVAVLDQVGFVCKAAKMQLTTLYKSPRPNHLFLGMDFHLLDIEIDELVDMIPYVDTLMPMLTSFSGDANFHLAAETYLNAYYQPKISTMRGAAAITAKDLVVLDNETFDKIAKLMLFKKKTENKFDSLDVEMTLFKNEIEMYPSMLSMDKYQVCVSGFQSLADACNYHLEILKCPLPFRLAVDVKGIKPFKIKLGKVNYAKMYVPEKRNAVQAQTLELKQLIRQSLERNVKESTKTMKKEGE